MSTVSDKIKTSIQTRMARSGYALIRVEPRERPRQVDQRPDLLNEIEQQVRRLDLNQADWEIWQSPEAVMGYLAPSRVNSYQQTINLCGEHGLNLNGKTVLDVGTCSGYLLRSIDEQFSDVTLIGADYYEECIRLSAALVPNAKLVHASIDDLADQGMKADVVFCTEVLEHILDTETQIPRLLSMVNPGGALVATVPHGRYDFTGPFTSEDGMSFVGHVNYWTKHSWDFYLDRITATLDHPVTVSTGTLGNNFEGDVLYAVIQKA